MEKGKKGKEGKEMSCRRQLSERQVRSHIGADLKGGAAYPPARLASLAPVDSNHHRRIQRPVSCHWTRGHQPLTKQRLTVNA